MLTIPGEMTKDEKKKSNWRDKYRFTVVNDHTFEELWRIRLTRYNAFILISSLLLFLIGGTMALISFTNLREFIPGYPDVEMRRNILLSAIRLDSLERELQLRDNYFVNLSNIISGKAPAQNLMIQDTSNTFGIVDLSPFSDEASLADATGEKENDLSITPPQIANLTEFSRLHFFPPVKGLISSKFDVRTGHFGTDIVTNPRALVSAALDGTVIFTGWTMETGFVIQIQHQNDIVSIYKHNSSILKEAGDLVKAGEPVSVVGDSGELFTSGPHLHFEIWYKGTPLDPEKHIIF